MVLRRAGALVAHIGGRAGADDIAYLRRVRPRIGVGLVGRLIRLAADPINGADARVVRRSQEGVSDACGAVSHLCGRDIDAPARRHDVERGLRLRRLLRVVIGIALDLRLDRIRRRRLKTGRQVDRCGAGELVEIPPGAKTLALADIGEERRFAAGNGR